MLLGANFAGAFFEEVGAFVIVALLVWRKVLPPLKGLMDRRAETIRAQLAAGDDARRAAEELLVARRRELEEAHLEAGAIVEQAKVNAAQLVADGARRAAAERERLIGRAAGEIDQLVARARDEVAAEMAVLVVAGARRVVEAELDAGLHHRLIGEAIGSAETEVP